MSSSGGTPSIPRPLARKEPLHGTALQMEPAQPGQTYSDRPDPGRCPGLPPARASFLSLLGTLFVGALKALAPLLVFFLVLHSLAQHKKGAKSNMSTVIALYLIGTLLAALCAVVASFLFPSTLALAQEAASSAPGGIGEILQTLLNNAVSNPISAMAEANYIGVLLWAVVFGIALRDASDRTKQVLGDLSDALSTAIRWVISCAPFGILGLVFTTVSETGFSSFMDYGRLLCVLAGCMFSWP